MVNGSFSVCFASTLALSYSLGLFDLSPQSLSFLF